MKDVAKGENEVVVQRNYYPHLSSEEVEKKIASLSPNQSDRFNEVLVLNGEDRRAALFIASSYPIIDKEAR